MTRLTERLEILRVEELGFVTTVWLDVIHDVSGGDTALLGAELAERLPLKLVIAQPIPRLRSIQMSIRSRRHNYRANWLYRRRDLSGVVTKILL